MVTARGAASTAGSATGRSSAAGRGRRVWAGRTTAGRLPAEVVTKAVADMVLLLRVRLRRVSARPDGYFSHVRDGFNDAPKRRSEQRRRRPENGSDAART